MSPFEIGHVIFQPSIFNCHVSFQEVFSSRNHPPIRRVVTPSNGSLVLVRESPQIPLIQV